jgi:hypothetical protein
MRKVLLFHQIYDNLYLSNILKSDIVYFVLLVLIMKFQKFPESVIFIYGYFLSILQQSLRDHI